MKTLENEKNHLNAKLNDSQCILEKMKSELCLNQNKLSKIVDVLGNQNLLNDDNENEYPEVTKLKLLLRQQINESSLGQLQQQLNNLKNQLSDYENKSKSLESDIHILNIIAEEAHGNLCLTQEDLALISEELATVYHHVCHVNGETPNRVILDHAAASNANRTSSSSDNGVSGQSSLKLEQMRERLNNANLLSNWKASSTSVECNRVLETVRDQVRHLKNAIELTIEMKSQRLKLNEVSASISASPSMQTLATNNGDSITSSADAEEMQEQAVKLKALLSTKREQIATLRTVLKANKQTAEVALANLKSKYETEKAVVTETMTKLRNELKALKEDAATFASLRSMFAARCEEYVTQIDELQRQLQASEDEKKTLNSLLRIAIQQKLSITQKLEDYEMDKERTSLSSPFKTAPGKERVPSSRGGNGGRARNPGFRNLNPRPPNGPQTNSRTVPGLMNSQSAQNSPKRSF